MKSKKPNSPEFQDAVTKLILKDIFFTKLLYDLDIVQDESFDGVAATDAVHLIYNPIKFAEYPRESRIFILAHEIMHVVLFHSLRRGLREPTIWNIAADFVVNLMLEEHGMKGRPEQALFDTRYKNMTTEEVYNDLIKHAKKVSLPKGWQDVLDYEPGKNNGKSAKEMEKLIGINTAKAAASAKAAGKESKLIDRYTDACEVTRMPWHRILAQYMSAYNDKQFNWAKPDFKRSQAYGMLIPRMQSESMGKAVVSVDTSGSMTEKMLGSISSHMNDMFNEVRPSSVVIQYFDSEVVRVDEFEGPHYDIKLQMVGGGGTDFNPPVALAEQVAEAQVHIIFTDMCGPMPNDSSLPTLWVTNYVSDAMFGDVIEADFND